MCSGGDVEDDVSHSCQFLSHDRWIRQVGGCGNFSCLYKMELFLNFIFKAGSHPSSLENLHVNLYRTSKNLHFIWKWKLHFDTSVSVFVFLFQSKLFEDVHVWQTFLSSKLFMFLYVLVEMEFAYDTFLHHHQWLKQFRVMELMLHSHFCLRYPVAWFG